MGLIKSAKSAISETLKEQWKEVIRSENMDNNLLMVKKTTESGVITKDSTIIVAPGQCAFIYDNGKILDATAEDGIYTFDESTSPSFFGGQFGEVFKEMWDRFTYNGGTFKEQYVFFLNTKEILDNKFGTTSPIPYQDWSHPYLNEMTGQMMPLAVEVIGHGSYTFKISDPALFMNNIAGTAERYTKEEIVDQMRAEVTSVFRNILNELGNSENKVPLYELDSQTDEIVEMMKEKVFDEPIRNRGLKIETFIIEQARASEDSETRIKEYEFSASSHMQKGKLVDSYAEAVKGAANNEAGSLNGFMGIGIMNMNTGNLFGNVAADTMNVQPQAAQSNRQDNWKCTCGVENTGKFCSECGNPKEKKCPKCEAVNSSEAKFCKECGEKL